ncbi:hypothetical protein ANAPC5_01271 [Anaplasma phagocytophilum]|nr:hypothetical protein ANAPC5_01271 [Anaplasma phagocytophilum]
MRIGPTFHAMATDSLIKRCLLSSAAISCVPKSVSGYSVATQVDAVIRTTCNAFPFSNERAIKDIGCARVFSATRRTPVALVCCVRS